MPWRTHISIQPAVDASCGRGAKGWGKPQETVSGVAESSSSKVSDHVLLFQQEKVKWLVPFKMIQDFASIECLFDKCLQT